MYIYFKLLILLQSINMHVMNDELLIYSIINYSYKEYRSYSAGGGGRGNGRTYTHKPNPSSQNDYYNFLESDDEEESTGNYHRL